MATFIYQGLDAKGQSRKGEVQAQSRAEALRKLSHDRIQPIKLTSREESSRVIIGPSKSPVKTSGFIYLSKKDIVLFTDELSDFLNSGMQLESALRLMENREEKSTIKGLAKRLREKVRDGTSFADALRQTSPSFGELYYNIVAAGEASGALGPLLTRQAAHLAEIQELRSQVQMALIYPAFLVLAGIAAMVVFMTFLVPQMLKLFAHSGAQMPLPTYVLFMTGRFFQQFGLVTLIGGTVLLLSFFAFVQQPKGRIWWDRFKLRLPLLGPLWYASFHGEFCQLLANLLNNGLPLVSSLKLISRATGNTFFNGSVARVADLVSEGVSLTQAMKTVDQFPANLRDLVKVGEQTGELGVCLEKIGKRYEKLIKRKMDQVMSVVQPVIILVIGSAVGLVAWSMLAGIFQAMHAIRGHA